MTPPVVPRRILMTADTVGGVWTYALELAGGLARHGVQVVLATMGAPADSAQRAAAAKLSNLELRESSFKLEWMPGPWEDVRRAGDWLLEIEAGTRPDVVHLNGYCHGDLPWAAPTLVVGHSCVLSWWQAVHHCEAPADWDLYRARVRAGLQAAGCVVAPSRFMLSELQRLYGPLPRSRVIPNGRRLLTESDEQREPIVFCAGRLWDQAKNVAALAAISADLPWPVYVAGQQNASNPLEFSQTMRCLGHLAPETLQSWLRRASIYALPARYEPFGLSVLEAALAGCALVLGDIPSLRDNWDGAARFVPADSPAALREAIQELISDPALRRQLSQRARAIAANLTPERMCHDHLEVYSELLATAPASHRISGASIADAAVITPQPANVCA